jgi:hypothetical protein
MLSAGNARGAPAIKRRRGEGRRLSQSTIDNLAETTALAARRAYPEQPYVLSRVL